MPSNCLELGKFSVAVDDAGVRVYASKSLLHLHKLRLKMDYRERTLSLGRSPLYETALQMTSTFSMPGWRLNPPPSLRCVVVVHFLFSMGLRERRFKVVLGEVRFKRKFWEHLPGNIERGWRYRTSSPNLRPLQTLRVAGEFTFQFSISKVQKRRGKPVPISRIRTSSQVRKDSRMTVHFQDTVERGNARIAARFRVWIRTMFWYFDGQIASAYAKPYDC
ncbi:hypothetical protein M413DRAFT_14501 [Hebeloma cylindrosporum]|uniref:Uncharacterized protein n=1 Tax=Hebeloma cylindrosporum TaxID=76867 RepID=A0A0C3BU26_HEBCY|nr:hypothetical protein M413DRAFT_14501 [Hebeloma cylindrosporum h7]